MKDIELPNDQEAWVRRRKPRYGLNRAKLRELLQIGEGKCALSGVEMLFDSISTNPGKGKGSGCHPLSPAIDHIDPGNEEGPFQIVCYALNDVKGHLPLACYEALRHTKAWKNLMKRWYDQALKDSDDREAFKRLLRPNANSK